MPRADATPDHRGPTTPATGARSVTPLRLDPAAIADLDAPAAALSLGLTFGFPPQADGPGEARAVLGEFAKTAHDPEWGAFWGIDEENGIVVGLCGYKGPPAGGRVEIAYFTFPEFEGAGNATRMASALCARAGRGQSLQILAHTLPETNASNAVLRRCGFAFDGPAVDEEDGDVWRWSRATP